MATIIEKLRELDKKATSGPWEFFDYVEDEYPLCIVDKNRDPIVDGTGWSICEFDAELIAAMRNSLPLFLELVDAVEERKNYGKYSDSLHDETCASMHATMSCNCGAEEIYRALAKLKGAGDE